MTTQDYPPEMAHLAPEVRERAVKLLHELVEEGYPEVQAIPLAIRRVAANHRTEEAGDVAEAEAEKYVTPHEEGWAVVSPTGEHQTSLYATKEEALAKARELARKEHSRIRVEDGDERIIEPDGEDGN
ncbi:MAG TPA: DUF2188 domain-containing protein [Gammaproteobacteria bacterium]|nr:DUF2188 domain-containing protein [Gammaproteobacteria bacterium]